MDLNVKRRRLVIARLRQIDAWGPARATTKKLANGICNKCKKYFPKLFIDHIVPVFDPKEPNPFEAVLDICKCGICAWFRRLFVKAEGRQALCKDCHQNKSNGENVVRRKTRNEKH